MKHREPDQGRSVRRAKPANGRGTAEAVIAASPAPARSIETLTRAAFISLCTGPGDAGSEAVLYANNPVGDALLSSSVASFTGAAVSRMAPLLPVGTAGLDVHESLHRLDANAHMPTIDRGVTSANRVGEVLGTISMRWLLAPDDHEATPSAAPPPTEMRPDRSQRFVMHEGLISFQDRGQGGMRFFGAGRTTPTTINNQPRLLFAGTAVILEGVGSLKNVRGTLMISGEVTPPSAIALTIVGRLDPGGPIAVEDSLGPLLDVSGSEPPTVVFTIAGISSAGARDERLIAARIGNDVPNATHLRSLFRAGNVVGTARGPIAFDAVERRCAVPLEGMQRELAFTDAAGRRIASVTLDALEGTSQRETVGGVPVNRTVAYGRLSGGTGAFAGAAGVVSVDTAVDEAGGTSSLYVFRVADPEGRFRASFADRYRPMPAMASGAPPPPSTDTLRFVDSCAANITQVDRTILTYAERTLADGMELARWWEAKDRVGDYAEQFDVVREYNPSDRSFGFFDKAVIAGAGLPVMGVVQEMFYDRQKMATGETIREQMREFVLRYFMRVSHYRQPDAVPAGRRAPSSVLQRAISWLPEEEERRVGFGYQQLYYKVRESGQIGKFGPDEQRAIVDLRDVGPVYDWIVLKVDIFDFNLSFAPFGPDALKMQLPLKESTYLVLGPSFVKNCENPESGVLAQYGFGYAFVPYAPEPGMIAYGPGHFAAAIQTVDFKVMEDGEIRVRAAFVVNRPNKIANVDVAPLEWGFQLADIMTFNMASRLMAPMKTVAERLPMRVNGVDPISAYIWMANALTGGLAEKRFGISKSVLEKRMLVQHFMQHYEMLINSLLVWRTVPDWTDHDRLPAYCRPGMAC